MKDSPISFSRFLIKTLKTLAFEHVAYLAASTVLSGPGSNPPHKQDKFYVAASKLVTFVEVIAHNKTEAQWGNKTHNETEVEGAFLSFRFNSNKPWQLC